MGHRVSIVVSFVSLEYLSLYACSFIVLIAKLDPCLCRVLFEMARRNLRNNRNLAMSEIGDAVDSIREMAAAVQQLVGSSRTTPEVHGQGESRELVAAREFKRQNPPSYGGESNPLVAKS